MTGNHSKSMEACFLFLKVRNYLNTKCFIVDPIVITIAVIPPCNHHDHHHGNDNGDSNNNSLLLL